MRQVGAMRQVAEIGLNPNPIPWKVIGGNLLLRGKYCLTLKGG